MRRLPRSIGAIDKQTMREREHLSQPVFARYLNVSKNLVSDWEAWRKKTRRTRLAAAPLVQKKGVAAIVQRCVERWR